MDRFMKIKPRPDTPTVRSKKRSFFAEAAEMASYSPVAARLMKKAAKQGDNLLSKVIGPKAMAARGALKQILPRVSPIHENYQGRKRKRLSSGRKSPKSPALCSPKKKKRNIIKRAKRRATLFGQEAVGIVKAVKKNPPKLTTTLLCGYYTATFQLTPSKFKAIDEAVQKASPPRKMLKMKTPSPKKQKALKILGIAAEDQQQGAANDESYPKVVNNEGILFPFHYFDRRQNEGAAMMGAVPYKYKPSPGVLYAQTGVTSPPPPPPSAPAPEPPLLPGQNQELLL